MKRTAAVIALIATLAQGQASAQVQPAARIGATDVSIADVDALAAERLTKVRNEEYQIRRQVLDGLIERRLIEAEAKARGVPPAELEKAEITSKAETVTLEQARAVLDSAPEKYASMSQEQALSQIATGLQRTRLAAARKAFFVAARKKHGVTVFLDAPKVTIDSAGAPAKGPAEAPVTMVAFSDFQCPYCLRVNPADKGRTWTTLYETAESLRSIHAGRRDPRLILAGTQLDPRRSTQPDAVYRSLDAGVTWTRHALDGRSRGLIPWDIEEDLNGAIYSGTEIYDHPQPYRPPFFRSPDLGAVWQET